MKVRKVEARETGGDEGKGKGVFALYNIQKGQTVMSFGGTRLPVEEVHATLKRGENLWWNDYARFVSETHMVVPKSRDDFGGHLLDHSCNPNAHFRGDTVLATRAIARGEEVTCCYGWISEKEDHECRCDAEVCAGIMGVGIIVTDAGLPDMRVRVRSVTVGAVLGAAVLNGRRDIHEQYSQDLLRSYADAGASRPWLEACTAWAVAAMEERKKIGHRERKVMVALSSVEPGASVPAPPPDLTF